MIKRTSYVDNLCAKLRKSMGQVVVSFVELAGWSSGHVNNHSFSTETYPFSTTSSSTIKKILQPLLNGHTPQLPQGLLSLRRN